MIKIPKINLNRIKAVINPFTKVEQPVQIVFQEAKPDMFVKSPETAFDYLSEIIPTTEELLQNLNKAFEKGKASIEPKCAAESKYLPKRKEIYSKRQEELMKCVQQILATSENKKGIKAALHALSQNYKLFAQRANGGYQWVPPQRRYDNYHSSAQYIIKALELDADNPEKLNIIYKFIKKADFKTDFITRDFCECLKLEHYNPVEGRLKLIEKFTSEKFMPRWRAQDWADEDQWYYTRKPVYNTLKDLKYPEQMEFLDKVTNVNDKGETYNRFYYYIKDYNPEPAMFRSKFFDESACRLSKLAQQ